MQRVPAQQLLHTVPPASQPSSQRGSYRPGDGVSLRTPGHLRAFELASVSELEDWLLHFGVHSRRGLPKYHTARESFVSYSLTSETRQGVQGTWSGWLQIRFDTLYSDPYISLVRLCLWVKSVVSFLISLQSSSWRIASFSLC